MNPWGYQWSPRATHNLWSRMGSTEATHNPPRPSVIPLRPLVTHPRPPATLRGHFWSPRPNLTTKIPEATHNPRGHQQPTLKFKGGVGIRQIFKTWHFVKWSQNIIELQLEWFWQLLSVFPAIRINFVKISFAYSCFRAYVILASPKVHKNCFIYYIFIKKCIM
jgi:hypothetical protein